MIREYLAYLRDNPHGYWFKAKLYELGLPAGRQGWTPARWQGWTVLIAFLVWCVYNFRRLDAVSHSNSDTLRPFIVQTFFGVLLLLLICYKTGEKPRWQWGPPKK